MKRNLIAGLFISLLFFGSTTWANELTAQPFGSDKTASKYQQEAEKPTFISMAADAVLARPILLATTIIGTGLFMVTLPFSLLSNSVDQAGHTLVGAPAKATFERCLGCSFEQTKS